jgi:hypothetical protein
LALRLEGLLEDGEITEETLGLLAFVGDAAACRLLLIRDAPLPDHQRVSEWIGDLATRNVACAVRAAVVAARSALPAWLEEFPDGTRPLKALQCAEAVLERPSPRTAEEAEVASRRAEKNARKRSSSPRVVRARRAANAAVLAALAAARWGEDRRHPKTEEAAVEGVCLAASVCGAQEVVLPIQLDLIAWLLSDTDAQFPRPVERLELVADGHALRRPTPPPPEEAYSPQGELPSAPPEAVAPPVPVETVVEMQWPPEGLESLPPIQHCAPPRPWHMGDVVVVRERQRVTSLGEGTVVEIEVDRQSGYPNAVRVQFEEGPARGTWYSVALLTRVRDIYGQPIPLGEQ